MLKDDIIRLNKEGKPNSEIAIITGATSGYIKQCISDAGLQSNTLKKRAIELLKEGKSYDEICEMLGCTKNTIKGYFSVEGLTKKQDKVATQERFKKMYEMYVDENKSEEEIAEEFGFSIYYIKTCLSRLGALKIRDKRRKPELEKKQVDIIKEEKPVEKEEIKPYKPPKKSKSEVAIKENDISEKPYEILDDNMVIYKGKMYKILSRKELKRLLINDLNIKTSKNKFNHRRRNKV